MLGLSGDLFNSSSLVNGVTLKPATETADSKTKLSGYVRGGSSTTTFTLAGNVDTDAGNAQGLWQLAWDLAGEEVDFSFTPETSTGVTVTGVLIITPLDLGADEYGADLASDFEWNVVGTPTITRAGG